MRQELRRVLGSSVIGTFTVARTCSAFGPSAASYHPKAPFIAEFQSVQILASTCRATRSSPARGLADASTPLFDQRPAPAVHPVLGEARDSVGVQVPGCDLRGPWMMLGGSGQSGRPIFGDAVPVQKNCPGRDGFRAPTVPGRRTADTRHVPRPSRPSLPALNPQEQGARGMVIDEAAPDNLNAVHS